MSRKTPDAIRGQAETLAAAATAAARWFGKPDPAALSALRTARLRALGWREEAVAALGGERGPAKTDAADLSFALREAVECAARSVSDAAQWDVGAEPAFAAMAESLREAARALSRAAAAPVRERAEALIDAKRWAADVERRRRAQREALSAAPFSVDAAKRGEIAERLSAAAEALQQACDAFAGSLGE